VGPRRQLKVECGYGPLSPFESAGVGMGICCYLRVLVQVWPLSLVEGGGGSMHAHCHLKMLVQVWALIAMWSSWCGHGPLSSFGAVVVWSSRHYLRVVWVRVLVVVEVVGSHQCLSLLLHGGGGHGCLLMLCGSGCRCHRLLPIWVLVVIVVWW